MPKQNCRATRGPSRLESASRSPFGVRDKAGPRQAPSGLALLCYVESTIFGSNSVPQHGQQPISRTNHGCIACNACSHVTPEVFFGAQVNHRHKQIRYGSEDQMVVEPLPRPAL